MAGWRNVFGQEGRPYRRVLGAAAAAGSAAGIYFRVIRPRRQQVSTPAPARRMPGDLLLSGQVRQHTRSILIPAPPGDVWTVLNRMGHGRAGWYIFDRLDTAGNGSTDLIAPLRELDIGDLLSTGTGHRLRIKEVQPNEWMLWADGDERSTWLWLLQPVRVHQTRLLVRGRFRYGLRAGGLTGGLAALPRDAMDLATMRRCLTAIRDRAVQRSTARYDRK